MSQSLKYLLEGFIEKANRPMTLGGLPVSPKEAEAPVLPVERWKTDGGQLSKTYKFRRPEDRNAFVQELFLYEQEVQHNATIIVTEGHVKLVLYTKDLDKVTELDKEYAKYADVLFRDLVYSPVHE